MTSTGIEYPKQQSLWPGALLGSIAHAVVVARYPDLAHEQSWDGNNYSVQDSAGSRGTVAFSGNKFVGVFFSENSDRNPFKSEDPYDLQRFLVGLPDELASLAYSEALQYVLQDYKGNPLPILTTAFWGDGIQESIAAAEEWGKVVENGAFLINHQLLEQDEALTAWQVEYELSDEELALIMSLFQLKVSKFETQLLLSRDNFSLIKSIAEGEEGLEACRKSFGEIKISLK